MFLIFARMIFSTGDSEYGQRLNNLTKLDNKKMDEVASSVLAEDGVKDTDIRVQGRIVYMTIIFNEGTKLDKAKEIANSTISKYEDDVIEDYDFCFFLKEDVDNSDDTEKVGFVVAGTKHPTIDYISWTK